MTGKTSALAAEGQQLVVAALEEGVELVLDEARQFAAGAGFGAGSEAGRMLLHQAVQRSLLRVVTIVLDRGAIRCPLGLPTDGLQDGLPRW